jgi:hypothetical protein
MLLQHPLSCGRKHAEAAPSMSTNLAFAEAFRLAAGCLRGSNENTSCYPAEGGMLLQHLLQCGPKQC